MSENIFADEWVDCLEAHYMHVIRTKDKVTEPSLTIVMHSAGFSDNQLAELRVRATMHVDDVGADFVPDLDVLDIHDHDHQHEHSVLEAPEAHVYNIPIEVAPAPTEATPPAAVETVSAAPEIVAEVEVVVDNQVEDDSLTDEDEQQLDEASVQEEPEEEDPDAPQQLSLF